jgi:hypothetical protein
MEPDVSLLHLQVPAIYPYTERIYTFFLLFRPRQLLPSERLHTHHGPILNNVYK